MRWKQGILTENLISMGGSLLKKGSIVQYIRCKEYETGKFINKYEWHYRNLEHTILIRTSEFLITTIDNK